MDRYFDGEPIERVKTKSGEIKHVFRAYRTFEGFALSIGVVSDTLRRWAAETVTGSDEPLKPEFTLAYARARRIGKDTPFRSAD